MKVSQEKVSLSFKERLDDGNLWFLPFLFFNGFVASTENLNFNLIIFKVFWSVLARFLKETQAWVALGVNFLCGIADSAYWFATVTLLLQF